jgi:hypothetical protein
MRQSIKGHQRLFAVSMEDFAATKKVVPEMAVSWVEMGGGWLDFEQVKVRLAQAISRQGRWYRRVKTVN